jgi:hypothetical protein
VLLACLLGRIGADAASARAGRSFLAAELTLAYLVAGLSKATSGCWRSGNAFTIIAQTRMYSQPTAARVIRTYPAVGRAAGHAVLAWESLFILALTAPPALVVAPLAVGVGFHAGCAIVMGLNRFLWAFAAGYPALLCTNIAVRAEVGASTANAITIAVGVLGMLALAAGGGIGPTLAGERGRPSRLASRGGGR